MSSMLAHASRMINVNDAVSVGILLLGFKAWHDLLIYAHHRERMRAYRYLVHEGMALVRTALDASLRAEVK